MGMSFESSWRVMLIESVQINGFGCINGEYEFSKGLNLIVAGNEAGKTTLADALVAIIYGVKNIGRSGNGSSKPFKRYAPLGSESFSASAVVKTESGRRLNIWRDFALDKLRVLELSSGKDITLDFNLPPNGDSLGENLTGLSVNQYKKLATLSQDELNKNWDFVEFVDALSALFSTDDSHGVSVEEAKAVLESSIVSYEGLTGKGKLRVDTEIKRLHERIAQIDEEVAEINAVYSQVEQRFEEAANQRLKTKKIKDSIKKYDYLLCMLHRDELLEKLEEKSAARERITDVQAEIAELIPIKEFEFVSIEHMTELLTLFNDKVERQQDVKSLRQTSSEELEYLRIRVENLGKRSNVSEDDLQRIEQNIAILENNLGREKSVRIDCRSAEGVMIEAGVGSEEIRKYNKWKSVSREVEVEFVDNYPRIKEQIENKENNLKHEREQHLSTLREIASERMYRYKFSRNNLILGCIFTAMSVFSFVAMGFLLFMLIPAVACVGWAIFGAIKLVGVQNIGIDEEAHAQEEIVRLDEILAGFAEKYEKMEAKLESFSEEIGLDREDLLSLTQRVKKARKEVDVWEQKVDRHNALDSVINECLATLKKIFCEIGIADTSTRLDITRAKVFLREVSDALSIIKQFEDVAEKDRAISSQIELLQDEIDEITAELVDCFERAGVDLVDKDYSSAMDDFRVRLSSLKRLEQLESVILNEAISAAGDKDEIDIINSEVSTWDNRLSKMLEEDPWLEVHKPCLGVLEYGSEIKLARTKLEDTEGELVEREKALAIEEGRRRERLPFLEDEKAEALRALRRAERFEASVSEALSVLDTISNELHARWSPLFSEEFNSYIERFSSNMEFSLSKNLKLCAVLRENGMAISSDDIAEYMSKGMRDQVYLSLRLLLSQKVARDEAIPVILDDPFINADERRFKEGMNQLLELSKSTQVFVFSCHEIRHEDLCFEKEDFADAVVKL